MIYDSSKLGEFKCVATTEWKTNCGIFIKWNAYSNKKETN